MASKKSRRSPPAKENNPTDLTEEALENAMTNFRTEVAEREVNETPQPKQLSLSEIRAAVLRTHTHTAHTIADLEAWRDEIEATLAFLRARGR